MQGIQRSPEGGYILAFKTPEGPRRLHAKVAVCTAPAHRMGSVEGLRVRKKTSSRVDSGELREEPIVTRRKKTTSSETLYWFWTP